MSNFIIQLKEMKPDDFHLLKAVLNDYAGSQKTLAVVMPDTHSFMKDFSITVELWYEFNKKTALQNPPAKSNLKLSLHKGLILLEALRDFMRQRSSMDYERSRCNRFAMAIDEQLPTKTQLIS